MKVVSNSKIVLSCIALLFLLAGSSPGQTAVIDDFEDGAIDTGIWWYGGGNLYDPRGTNAWGEVYEANGKLVLDCQDLEGRYSSSVKRGKPLRFWRDRLVQEFMS